MQPGGTCRKGRLFIELNLAVPLVQLCFDPISVFDKLYLNFFA
jgi:hypothetical protein